MSENEAEENGCEEWWRIKGEAESMERGEQINEKQLQQIKYKSKKDIKEQWKDERNTYGGGAG